MTYYLLFASAILQSTLAAGALAGAVVIVFSRKPDGKVNLPENAVSAAGYILVAAILCFTAAFTAGLQ